MAEKTALATQGGCVPAPREATRDWETHLYPPVDIYETEDGLTVVADVPGVGKDVLDVHVEDNVLTIEGRTRHVAPRDPVWSEYRLLHFFRQFELPDAVDQAKISAELKNGVLTIHLPKAEAAKPRQIKINVA